MKKLLVLVSILTIICASLAFAAPKGNVINVTLAFDAQSTILRSTGGYALNPITGNIIIADWTFAGWTSSPPQMATIHSSINGSQVGVLTIDPGSQLYSDMTLRNGLPLFGMGVDNDGVIWGYFQGTRPDASGYDAFVRWADETSFPTLAWDTAGTDVPDFARAGTAVGGAISGKLRVGTLGNADNGRIRIYGSNDGLTLISVDTIPPPAGKVGVAFDPRSTDPSGFPNTVFASAPWATPDVIGYKHVVAGTWSSISSPAYPGIWLASSTQFDTYIAAISTTTTIVITNGSNIGSTIDVAWGIYISQDYNIDHVLFAETEDSGEPMGGIYAGASGTDTDYPQLRTSFYNQPLVRYISSSVHRVVLPARVATGVSGILGFDYQIDYVPTNSLSITPPSLAVNPSQTIGVNVSHGVPPYTWNLSAPAGGSLDTTGGPDVIYTAGSSAPDTAVLVVTDNAFQSKTINIVITPTSAPLVSDLTMAVSDSKEVIRYDFFE